MTSLRRVGPPSVAPPPVAPPSVALTAALIPALLAALLLGMGAAVRAADDSPQPPATLALPADLSVQYISQTPRYPRYRVEYLGGVPRLVPGTEDDKHFPDPGEVVTLTAHVANQGGAATRATTYAWSVDGVTTSGGLLPAMEAGEAISLTTHWAWQTGVHTATLSLATGGDEVTLANNVLDHRTDAHYLEILAHPYFRDAFALYRNLVGSYSFEDWMQAQVRAMNARLAEAVYPSTPRGVADRVRIDTIRFTTELGDDTVTGSYQYDGRWAFRPEPDDRHTPEDEAWESAVQHARDFADAIEWNLIHELTHQLGVIDLYWLNVSASRANPLLDDEGLPLLLGFQFSQPGLMGGDASARGETFYSEHTALGLATDTGYRRGYFGEYLYDMPAQIWVRVLDRDGVGVPGAQIVAYQTDHTWLQAAPVFSGQTDAEGYFLLPNRAAPVVTTATGHALRPNPYGQIDVVAQNGQLLLKVTWQGQEHYQWLPITEMNKAKWAGEDVVTVTLATAFPAAADAQLPRPEPSVQVRSSQALLSWEPVPGAAAYNVYRGVWPAYYPLSLGASGVTDLTFTATLTNPTRFGVSAVWPNGAESDLGTLARAEPLYEPFGLAWEPDGSALYTVDAHRGALLEALPGKAGSPLRWVGQVGSEHYNLVDAHGLALGPGGSTGVAVEGSRRAWVLDQGHVLINWLGQAGDYPTDWGHPTALLLAGEPLTVAVSAGIPDQATLLGFSFDDGLVGAGGEAPEVAEGVTSEPGRLGAGVRMAPRSTLVYDAQGNVDLTRGSLELWVQPDWPGAPEEERVLVDITDVSGGLGPPAAGPYSLRLGLYEDSVYAYATDYDLHEATVYGEAWRWQPGEWHHVGLTWDEHRMSLYLDGRWEGDALMRHPITGTAAYISVGGTITGSFSADAVLDELRISAYPRLGNSSDGRVIVAERDPARVDVLDLLGNPISRYAPPSGSPNALAEPSALAWTGGSQVWLADASQRRVDLLAFSGDELSYVRSLGVSWPNAPRALAGYGDLLAVGAGAQVALVNPNGGDSVSQMWDRPPGGAEPFGQVTALAFGPQGDLAVASMNGPRISIIMDAAYTHRLSLPRLSKQAR